MGLFDPVHKKMLAKSPAGFQSMMQVLGPLLETIILNRSPLNPDIFRAMVIGMLALRSANNNPAIWPRDTLSFITFNTNNAFKHMAPDDRALAEQTFASIVTELGEP